jgi:hypothetical protein
MNETFSKSNTCCCHNKKKDEIKKEILNRDKPNFRFKSLSSATLSVLIAFFPKCPICWACYMSLFGFLGLTQLPYMPWLLSILLLFLGIYLIILYRKSPKKWLHPFSFKSCWCNSSPHWKTIFSSRRMDCSTGYDFYYLKFFMVKLWCTNYKIFSR